ncbi:hypothetical protein ACJMK2_040407 [Sinanodonta woodiana]|uniref:CSD domain-containing protein n=1 Tax=Sinanodonta woodiana TaxID=1069815 RepID=A0ABD3WJ06_SINWO
MSDSENRPERSVKAERKVIATKVTGTVKSFSVKSGYGFINRDDTKEDVFVHQTSIIKNNHRKSIRSIGDGETVEFDVVTGTKRNEAINVTGPAGMNVQGGKYAADRRIYRGIVRRPIQHDQEEEGKVQHKFSGQPSRRPYHRRYYDGYARPQQRRYEENIKKSGDVGAPRRSSYFPSYYQGSRYYFGGPPAGDGQGVRGRGRGRRHGRKLGSGGHSHKDVPRKDCDLIPRKIFRRNRVYRLLPLWSLARNLQILTLTSTGMLYRKDDPDGP